VKFVTDMDREHTYEMLTYKSAVTKRCQSLKLFYRIVTDLINALPGNSFLNTNTGNNRIEAVFSVRSVLNKSTEVWEICCQATQL
jgi:hypothetical protein